MSEQMRILSGMRPTGRFHLGNYLGAAKNWVELQNQYECFYFVADYHALTTEPDGHKVEDKVFDLTADLIAVGIDPKRSVLYLQSRVPEVAELSLLLSIVTPLSWLLRTPTFKDMARQHPDNVNLGLLSYPILQGADILMVKGGGVPVGKDQLAHLELIREVTRKQMLSMVTDVKRPRKTDPGHPRSCNVCAYYKLFFDDWEHYWELCRKAQIGCFDKKKLLAERLIEVFRPFRDMRAELSPDMVNAILDDGSEKARQVARHTLREAREAVGLPAYLDR